MGAANPTTALIIFLIITLAYFIIKYFVTSPTQIKIWTFVYYLLVVVSQFAINVSITKDVCGFNQFGLAAITTFVPWIVIFGFLNLMLIMFPGWLIPFSNTIGYFFCYVTGISKFFKSILKDRNTLNLDKNKAAIVQALDNVYEDSSMLINQITIPELPEWWKTMKEGGLLKAGVGNDQYNELSKYILLKNNISEFTWFVLTGGLVTSASYNYILNSGCQQSVSEMKKRHTEYVEKDKKISENAKKGGSKQMVYKGYE
jgi:hypothetical protein